MFLSKIFLFAFLSEISAMSIIKRFPAASLYVSQPPPDHFGNPRNPGAGAPGWTNANWLKSRFHFNFAEFAGGRTNFGVLRVMNDDLVQPSRGFGEHGHRDMEILTYIVRGNLTHQDSMGTSETLGRHAIQFMSAGSGVRHSEHNRSPSGDLRFIQIWITPAQRGLPPNYGSHIPADFKRNVVHHLAGPSASLIPGAVRAPISIQQDANLSVALLDAGASLHLFELAPRRQAYAIVMEGGGSFGGQTVDEGDGVEVHATAGPLTVVAGADGLHILFIEMAK